MARSPSRPSPSRSAAWPFIWSASRAPVEGSPRLRAERVQVASEPGGGQARAKNTAELKFPLSLSGKQRKAVGAGEEYGRYRPDQSSLHGVLLGLGARAALDGEESKSSAIRPFAARGADPRPARGDNSRRERGPHRFRSVCAGGPCRADRDDRA